MLACYIFSGHTHEQVPSAHSQLGLYLWWALSWHQIECSRDNREKVLRGLDITKKKLVVNMRNNHFRTQKQSKQCIHQGVQWGLANEILVFHVLKTWFPFFTLCPNLWRFIWISFVDKLIWSFSILCFINTINDENIITIPELFSKLFSIFFSQIHAELSNISVEPLLFRIILPNHKSGYE